ncbi:nucleoside-diphosphate sugar epimerase/dehydratase [Aquibium sp. LZ166]|uniref:Nucleoside-diphosphate sugar epimerase/dehydratase n=1 Tax=Aquibium pacificus TaxID=3153579 RepID=A0ABV3SIR4_9HYPH
MRRLIIVAMDVAMVLAAVPLSLALSGSNLSIDPYSGSALMAWLSVGVFGHLLFRYSGLYRMMWRFASTPDFFGIFRNCLILTISLYLTAISIRMFYPIAGLNERQFIVFFMMSFVFISSPRLMYRYLREGSGWSMGELGFRKRPSTRALFFGRLNDADMIINYGRSAADDAIDIIGIISPEETDVMGSRVQNVPVVGRKEQARHVLYEYLKDSEKIAMIIFGQHADKEFAEFPELVRIARQHGVDVDQFSGVLQSRRAGKLVLERVEMETILRRTTVTPDEQMLASILRDKRILVTGGAGSIGRTLVKRALDMQAQAVLVADISEFNIFQLQSDLARIHEERLIARLVDICDRQAFARVVKDFRPDVIFHAAALKHVPILEENWISAVGTNVFGTRNCVEVAAECKVPHFVLISSDKAADPSSVLGFTKRVAEQIVNSMHYMQTMRTAAFGRATNFIGVRFGNVFGSDGSVSTIFQRQIDAGGPVTITDPAMTRYLMTIGEAVDLVILSAADSAQRRPEDGPGIYMLDMGEPVSIMAVADIMIRLAGKEPNRDIPIVVTGRRPGEKVHEILSAPGEDIADIGVPSVFGLRTGVFDWKEIAAALERLSNAVERDDKDDAMAIMKALYKPAISHRAEGGPAEVPQNGAGSDTAAHSAEYKNGKPAFEPLAGKSVVAKEARGDRPVQGLPKVVHFPARLPPSELEAAKS